MSTFRAFRHDPLAFFERLAQSVDLVRFCLPGYRSIFVNEPAAIQPDVYDTERFTDQARAARPASVYRPASGVTDSAAGAANLLQSVELRLPAGVQVSPAVQISLRPPGEVPMRYEKRGV